MANEAGNLKFVILESPYDTWGHPETERLFARMCGLKLRGYGNEYPYGVLATDTTDMISHHLLICEETDDGLIPIFGNKSVPLSKCDAHLVSFPALSLFEQARAPEHAEAMRGLMSEAREKGRDLRYAGSWTVEPRVRTSKERAKELKEMFTALYIAYHLEVPKLQLLTGATVRFKVPELVKTLGHHAMRSGSKELGPVNVHHLAGELVLMTLLTEFTFEARQLAKKWEPMWKSHLRIAMGHVDSVKKAA